MIPHIRNWARRAGHDRMFFWSAVSAALFLAAWQFVFGPFKTVQALSHYADRGEFLFHAIRSKSVSFAMPLPGMVLAWFKFHLSADPFLPFRAAGLLTCLAAYAAGSAGGSRGRGALFAFAAALASLRSAANEAEQVFYAFSLMVFLALELRRQERGGFAVSAASGLAAGFSMLVRSPLFLFPPLAAARGLVRSRNDRSGARKGRFAAAALLFIVCAYLPVAPWARLNHYLFGRVILFEEARPSSNIITGAKGLVFTIEGDARAFAGLSRDESVYPWAVKTVLADPLHYASAVAKRALAVFLMSPFLFLLAAAGLFLCRSPENRFVGLLAAYFVAVHCLLAVEERYFYPLRYLLAVMAAAGAWELLSAGKKAPAAGAERSVLPSALFLALAIPSAAVLVKVWDYPSSAGYGLPALAAGAEKYPADPWLLRKEGEAYLSFGLTAAGLDRLSRACGAHYRDLCYLSYALDSEKPEYPSESLPEWYELTLVKMLRELQLGLYGEARATLARAREHWGSERNAVRSEDDAGHLDAIRRANLTFWDSDIRAALLYWPPKERAELLSRLARIGTLTPRLRCLMAFSRGGTAAASCRDSFPEDAVGAEFDWSGNLREILSALLTAARPKVVSGGSPVAALLELRSSPREILDVFDVERAAGPGPALRAAAAAYHFGLGSADGREAAGTLYRLDKENFVYALVWLGSEDYSPSAVSEVSRGISARPYPLAAAAAAYLSRGEEKKALDLARTAAHGPLPEEGWNKVLLVFQGAGKYGEGAAAATRALAAYPGSAGLLNGRGVLRTLAGDKDGAVSDLRKALVSDPDHSPAAMGLAYLMEDRGEKEEAAALYRSVLEKKGADPSARSAARAALVRMGK